MFDYCGKPYDLAVISEEQGLLSVLLSLSQILVRKTSMSIKDSGDLQSGKQTHM